MNEINELKEWKNEKKITVASAAVIQLKFIFFKIDSNNIEETEFSSIIKA